MESMQQIERMLREKEDLNIKPQNYPIKILGQTFQENKLQSLSPHLGGHYYLSQFSVVTLRKHGCYQAALIGVTFHSPPILNTYHPRKCHSVLDFDNGFTCIPKGLMVHPPMRRRARMSSLMQLLYKNKINNVIKERKKYGMMNGKI